MMDIRALLKVKPTPAGEGYTTLELCDELGLCDCKVRALLKSGIRAGVVEVSNGYRKSIDGPMRRAPVYRILKGEKGMKGAKGKK
jgi:hypothetical protein